MRPILIPFESIDGSVGGDVDGVVVDIDVGGAVWAVVVVVVVVVVRRGDRFSGYLVSRPALPAASGRRAGNSILSMNFMY